MPQCLMPSAVWWGLSLLEEDSFYRAHIPLLTPAHLPYLYFTSPFPGRGVIYAHISAFPHHRTLLPRLHTRAPPHHPYRRDRPFWFWIDSFRQSLLGRMLLDLDPAVGCWQ